MSVINKLAFFAFALEAASNLDAWAYKTVLQAWEQEFGKGSVPTPAQAQIVLAVSKHESGYGRGWGKGTSHAGAGSHNWGANAGKGFMHNDSVPTVGAGSKAIVQEYKSYNSDTEGAAGVIRLLFKNNAPMTRMNKDQLPQFVPESKKDKKEVAHVVLPGPGRADLIKKACETGDLIAFSKAMYWSSYYGGVGPNFKERILWHAKHLYNLLPAIASKIGQPLAWKIYDTDFLPETTDTAYLEKYKSQMPEVTNHAETDAAKIAENAKAETKPAEQMVPAGIQQEYQDLTKVLLA